MNKYVALSRESLYTDNNLSVTEIEAESEEDAHQQIEDSIATNFSQDWLFPIDEWVKFKNFIATK